MIILSAISCAAAVLISQPPGRAQEIAAPRTPHGPVVTRRNLLLVGGLAAVLLLFALRDYLTVLVAAVMVTLVSIAVVRNVVRERAQDRRVQALANFLGVMIAELQAGAQISAAMSHAAEDASDPDVASALSGAARHISAGRSGAVALQEQTHLVPELSEVASTWAVAERYGMSQITLLTAVRDRLDHRLRHAQSTAASLQGAYVTSAILACLPLLGIGMGFAMGVNTVAFLFGGGLGGIILCVGTAFLCGGVLLSSNIVSRAGRGGDRP